MYLVSVHFSGDKRTKRPFFLKKIDVRQWILFCILWNEFQHHMLTQSTLQHSIRNTQSCLCMYEKKCCVILLSYAGINRNVHYLTSHGLKAFMYGLWWLFIPPDDLGRPYVAVLLLYCFLQTNPFHINIRNTLWVQPHGPSALLSAAAASGGTHWI